MVETKKYSKNQVVAALMRIGHGDLSLYYTEGAVPAKEDPETFGHFIAWNAKKGQVRDSKVALPIVATRGAQDQMFFENALASLCLMDPRNFLRGIEFHRDLTKSGIPVTEGAGQHIKKAIRLYVSYRQNHVGLLTRAMLQHRASMKALYVLSRIKPLPLAQAVLFDRKPPKGSVFEAVSRLKDMSPAEAAGAILTKNIPFNIAVGAVGGVKDKPDIILALIEKMSHNELVANSAALQRMGVSSSPVLMAAFDKAIERAKKDKRASALKSGKAKTVVKDKKLKGRLDALQEDQLDTSVSKIDGDWLILGDKSPSMRQSISIAKEIAGLLAKQVSGKVYLIFFHEAPSKIYDVSGKTLSEIKEMTKGVRSSGYGTSIGCGVDYAMKKGILVDGIAVVSDGGENNRPYFSDAFKKYKEKFGIEPNAYLFLVHGDRNVIGKVPGLNTFDLRQDVDYYSLPNLVSSMKPGTYQLLEEVLDTPLNTYAEVFKERSDK